MKKTRMLTRAVIAFALCCSMLTGAAMAAGPARVVDLNGMTVTFNDKLPDVMPYASSETFIDEVRTTTRPFSISRACHPANGNHLVLFLENQGTTPIQISITLTKDGKTIRDTQIIEPKKPTQMNWPTYVTTANGNNGEGLTCTFTYEVKPSIIGQEITYWAFCQQRFE